MRWGAVFLLAAALAAGCGADEATGPPATAPAPAETGAGAETTGATAATETEPAATVVLDVYFARGETVGAAHRLVAETPAVGAAALEALLAGPSPAESAAGLQTEIPAGTVALGLTIEDGVATVDFSREFESGGGSLSMGLRVAQVVHTLTQLPAVDAVAFRLDSEPIEAIGGEGVIVDPPVGRADFESFAPAILVESPTVGEAVTSPLRLVGTANTFEATFQVNVLDADGTVLVDEFATATSGSGDRGTFDVTVTFPIGEEGPGTLVVFEYSAKDGSRINVVEIPVELEP